MEQRRKLWGEARAGREKEGKENLKCLKNERQVLTYGEEHCYIMSFPIHGTCLGFFEKCILQVTPGQNHAQI
ncbi:hypothetical protein CapIbe_001276 [Capra ibex]